MDPYQDASRQQKGAGWLAQPGLRLTRHDPMDLDDPGPLQSRSQPSSVPQPRRHTSSILHHGASKTTGRPPACQTFCADASTGSSRPIPSSTPSFRRFSGNGLKRKAFNLDNDEDIIIVEHPSGGQPITPPITPPSNSQRGQHAKEVIDLTGSDDDDVMIIDPPAAELTRQLRPQWPMTSAIRSEKRLKLTHRGSASAAIQTQVQQIPKEHAPKTDASEELEVLPSVESVVDFFTLPVEVRDKIYRLLLVSQGPIHVRQLWTERIRRPSRRYSKNDDLETRIDTAILSVCRRTAVEGTRILYSENSFLYQLRDHAEECFPRHPQRGQKDQETRTINLAKYSHLIRHTEIELEPNRTEPEYEKLMAAALGTLAPRSDAANHRLPPCGPIHLHTLTITISPLITASSHGSFFLNVTGFFSRARDVLKQLQRIHVDFLRINVHVNSHIKKSTNSSSSSSTHRRRRPKPYHLQTTLDMRYLPRHNNHHNNNNNNNKMESADDQQEEPLETLLWRNDALIHEARRRQSDKTAETLRHLRRHIEAACLRPEKELRRGGVWEEHGAAEARRREQRARLEARLDGYSDHGGEDDDDDEDEEEDWRLGGDRKFLIISFVKVGGQMRAYRA
ncbi:hypothetical protein C8A03DRAFT_14828 [Achaetomium macrosporum]|uniref:Uncharacterized protein n=1 Tax=Achaetomium macrosporum TaxID=79813 RepID=A0AAN7CCX9_9PEZI|nr:hypothetical protein C8A03DRAFT_14828 [Achaetomium macrosporum]